MANVNLLASKIIKSNRFLSLATTNKKGEIWCTPLSYVCDENVNFYFTTAIDSIHVDYIKENPFIAFSIFDSTKRVSDIDGLQIRGIVGEVEKSDLDRVVDMYYKHVFPDPAERELWVSPAENFTKDDFPVYRFFQIVPTEIYKRDTVNIDVDRRVDVDIDKLKDLMR